MVITRNFNVKCNYVDDIQIKSVRRGAEHDGPGSIGALLFPTNLAPAGVNMGIGIIGAGARGSNPRRLLAKSGIPAISSNSRRPESLAGRVRELGSSIKAGPG